MFIVTFVGCFATLGCVCCLFDVAVSVSLAMLRLFWIVSFVFCCYLLMFILVLRSWRLFVYVFTVACFGVICVYWLCVCCAVGFWLVVNCWCCLRLLLLVSLLFVIVGLLFWCLRCIVLFWRCLRFVFMLRDACFSFVWCVVCLCSSIRCGCVFFALILVCWWLVYLCLFAWLFVCLIGLRWLGVC